MKKIITLIVATIFSLNGFSQPLTYSKVIYDSLATDITAHSVVRAFDGGYIIAGVNWSKGLLVKLDSAGNLLWNKTYDGAVFTHIVRTSDSAYIVCGSVGDSITSLSNALCLKMDSNGNIIWSKAVRQMGYSLEMGHVEQTADSGCVMIGIAYQNPSPSTKIFVAKLDVAGNLQWKNLLTGGNNANYGLSVKEAPSGGYFLNALIENQVSSIFPSYAVLIKLDSAGTVISANRYGTGSTRPINFELTNNGLIFYLSTGYYAGLMRTDFSGSILWSKEYQFPSGSCINCYNSKINQSSDGGYLVVDGSDNFWGEMFKTDSTGNILFGLNLMLGATDAIEATDHGYFILGNGPLYGVFAPRVVWGQIGFIKTDSLGNDSTSSCAYQNTIGDSTTAIVSSSATFTSVMNATSFNVTLSEDSLLLVNYFGCVDFLGSSGGFDVDNSFSLSPNPATNELRIQNSELKIERIEIYNVLGEKIYTQPQTTNDKQQTVDVSQLPSGIYFIKVRGEKEERVAKFVKQ